MSGGPVAPIRPPTPVDAEALRVDVVRTAKLVGAAVDEGMIRRFVTAFEPFVTTSALSFRATTRAVSTGPSEVNFRYVDLETPHDPLAIARDAGLLRPDLPDALARFLPEVQRVFPILGYGVDAGSATGLEKIWPFFPHRPATVADVCALASLPDAVQAQIEHMARHDLDRVSLFAVDYRHETINLYFMKAPGTYAPDQIARMIADFGFEVPSDELLALCVRSIPIYLTFAWGSPRVERLCFSTVFEGPGPVPVHLHPTLERFVAGVPFATHAKNFIFNVALNRHGHYFKIENDYNGAMIQLMKQF